MIYHIQKAPHNQSIYKIGVISDTHGLLRENVLELLHTCDAILHGGDIHTQKAAEQLKAVAPFYAVRGNADKDWTAKFPETLSIELFGIKLFMIHNKSQIHKIQMKKELDLRDRSLIIYGHSHKYEQTQTGSQTWLNPGSCGPRRFTLPVTMAVIHTPGDGTFEIEKINLYTPSSKDNASTKADTSAKAGTSPADLKKIVICVMKETDKGSPIEKTAKKHRISKELAAQICRLYLTHPGVDADGILKKMGL